MFIGHQWFNFSQKKKSLEKKFRASPWNMLGSLPLLGEKGVRKSKARKN